MRLPLRPALGRDPPQPLASDQPTIGNTCCRRSISNGYDADPRGPFGLAWMSRMDIRQAIIAAAVIALLIVILWMSGVGNR